MIDAARLWPHHKVLIVGHRLGQEPPRFGQEQVCGRPVCEWIIPERYREVHRAGLDPFTAGESSRVLSQRLELFGLHADGHEFPIEITLTATEEPGVACHEDGFCREFRGPDRPMALSCGCPD
jgi:hypothetical protein